ncbi:MULTISPECIES: DUF6226 family protein [unclassified Frigoribacterium]|uniref:DUF6226 family protein n=1 Tax=unclassified Frigoribacterium TaxID=2627005 RepID=UPI0006F5B9FB|nr:MULTISPECIES: DUF6226 family protein [unclassified Frigoribacterium]KQO47679.1 hypothetical protein ASF07_09515 [Frigoribacterium sp. Leaf254]KQT39772.1 hypothetical protein ASG28_09520 [Frigoribacterium sp. Leaf415]
MEFTDVIAEVTRRFDSHSSAGKQWNDPHEHSDIVEEEYSRVTEPERYAVVGARARSWIDALEGLGLGTAQIVEAPPWAYGPSAARAVRVTPVTVDALSILVVMGSTEGIEDTVALGVGDPAVLIGMEPFCGCDACDSGSDYLLTAIDDMFTGIMDGGFLYAEGKDWKLTVGVNGWSASGSQDFDSLIDKARAGTSIGRLMITGGPWLT